ncbi:AGRL3-like protein [Mya arenaria]|uniref:AGRL3-like protein n=1 Tax=Mya arenaria TaxID=6604 RepID=A0ABY7EAQ7_MYAAR|nr:AGRL3-like protein [Mya arenaria]
MGETSDTSTSFPTSYSTTTQWSQNCAVLGRPDNGEVHYQSTTYRQNATYKCNNGYELVGDRVRQCQASGVWGGAQPSCLAKEKPRLTCKNNTDTRGTLWTEILANSTRSYDCKGDYKEALNTLTAVTTTNGTDGSTGLTDGEITALSGSLENVAALLSNSTDDLVSVNITESFMESASNLFDPSNQESWKAMKETVRNRNGNQKEINGPVLSLSLDPDIKYLDPPIRITFGHFLTNLSEPSCNYWTFGEDDQAGGWSTDGCSVEFSSQNQTVCKCTHLTNFAVLMSPFEQADADSTPLRIVSIVGIAVSMFCLLLTSFLYICLWRFLKNDGAVILLNLCVALLLFISVYLKNDRAVILLNLCIALLFSYIIFLAGVDRTESKISSTSRFESRDNDAQINRSNLVLNGTSETDEGRQFNSPIGGKAFGHIHRPTVAFNPPAECSSHTHDNRPTTKHRDSGKIELDSGEDNSYDYRRRSTES